jgi:hypothetical protein
MHLSLSYKRHTQRDQFLGAAMLAASTITKKSVLQQQVTHVYLEITLPALDQIQLTSGAGLGENSRDSKSWKREKKPTGNHEGPYQVMRNAKLMTKVMIPQCRLETSMLV